MRLHRFYIDKQIDKEIRIDNKELLHQWLKVFRLKSSDRIIVFNGSDYEYKGYFKLLTKNEAVIVINEKRVIKKQTEIELHIFQSIIKKDNFELVVEKCTEIGVSAFHPIISERSEKKNLNIERLNKIAIEAAEQSGKTIVPNIFNPEALEKIAANFSGELFVLDFDGSDFKKTIEQAKGKKFGIFIGPEGGWSDKERELFKQKGIKSISLGSQILRAETAAIALSALVLLN